MLRFGKSIRLTDPEMQAMKAMKIDVTGVKTGGDFANALYPWIEALDEVRPDVVEKMAREITQKKKNSG